MKKLVIIILLLVLCGSFLCSAAEERSAVVTDMPVAGLSMRWPLQFSETKGSVFAAGVSDLGDGIYYAYWYYCAASQEDAMRLMQANPYELKSDYLFYTFSVAENKDLSEVVKELNKTGFSISEEDMILIGQLDSWSFYLCMAFNPGFSAEVEAEYADEYAALCGMKDEIASAFTFSVPFNEYGDLTERIIRFEGTDLDGNPVSSETLFGENKMTLVNIWATWCGPCIKELSELQAIHTRNRDKGGAVVGLLIDDDVEKARQLISENGITYPVVLVPKEFSMIFPYQAIPTFFYVDGNGKFMETKFTGAYPEMYEDVLMALLDQI